MDKGELADGEEKTTAAGSNDAADERVIVGFGGKQIRKDCLYSMYL
jgi:hypothetical protein